VPADLQILPADEQLLPLPAVGLALKFDLKEPRPWSWS
jgi:hypothetical protein